MKRRKRFVCSYILMDEDEKEMELKKKKKKRQTENMQGKRGKASIVQ